MRTRRLWLPCAGALLVSACAAPGAPPPAAPPEPPQPAGHDVCEGSPPLPHAPLQGILRNARCDQDMYWSMSRVADMLGADCAYCHAPKAGVPGENDFPQMTHNKEIGNWMSTQLMQAIKPVDGSPMKCSSCHTDEQGRPVAKILGAPRDRVKANEWMSLVMVKKFVAADGSRLKCKSCHVGTPGTPGFHASVILHGEQLPAHGAPVAGAPAY